MDIIDRLSEIFKEFPGIGERQARRFVYFLMSRPGNYAENLSQQILELKKEIKQCEDCFQYFATEVALKTCVACRDPNADASVLMVLEKDSDLHSVRSSGVYGGKYFILGGLVPIVEKNTKKHVRIEELKKRLKRNGKLKEIILAFSMNREGENTDQYVRSELKNLDIKISSLGRGLSTGTELEYSDNDTLKNALKNRQ